jgi:SAM-dependent methyltransferase
MNTNPPTPRGALWHRSIKNHPDWIWRGDKLWHRAAVQIEPRCQNVSKVQSGFVANIYADQNRSKAVKTALQGLLDELNAETVAVNLGAGKTRYAGVVNLEISDGSNVDIVGHGADLPFKDDSVDLVIAQEVLEHVGDFTELVDEICRVLKPGGAFFCQVPFQIGFHPGPKDYWRFTLQGLEHLFSPPRWTREDLRITLGHGSGFYRIAVEFMAVNASCLTQRLYRPVKAAAALLFYPFKWFDFLTPFSAEKDRIPGGYLCIARKTEK